uniref:Uncharacterized protein n=1 Tax=Cucumis melo TaxID=3656 RepID=A0A9I9E3F8_CUCME
RSSSSSSSNFFDSRTLPREEASTAARFDDRSFDGRRLRRPQLRRQPPPRVIHRANRAATIHCFSSDDNHRLALFIDDHPAAATAVFNLSQPEPRSLLSNPSQTSQAKPLASHPSLQL